MCVLYLAVRAKYILLILGIESLDSNNLCFNVYINTQESLALVSSDFLLS